MLHTIVDKALRWAAANCALHLIAEMGNRLVACAGNYSTRPAFSDGTVAAASGVPISQSAEQRTANDPQRPEVDQSGERARLPQSKPADYPQLPAQTG